MGVYENDNKKGEINAVTYKSIFVLSEGDKKKSLS